MSMIPRYRSCFAVVASLFFAMAANVPAATLTAGPGKQFSKPCAAIAAAKAGDTIEIDGGGVYDGQACVGLVDLLHAVGME